MSVLYIETMHKTMTEAPAKMKRCKSLTSVNFNAILHNSNLMNINFGKLHYQKMPFSYANYSINLMLYVQPSEAIISIINVNEKKNS